MDSKARKEKIKRFMKNAKEVTCPVCGACYLTIETDLVCYECHTSIKYGAVIN